MIGAIRSAIDKFRGFGDAALSVPSYDGAFKPNMLIEEAPVLTNWNAPDNLARADGRTYFSSGNALLGVASTGAVELHEDAGPPITALAGNAQGQLAVARSGAGITLVRPDGKRTPLSGLEACPGDITAMAFLSDGQLALTIGAKGRTADQWREDFMSKGRTGSVWLTDLKGKLHQLVDKLAYPYGIVPDPAGRLLVSVSWDSALIRLSPSGGSTTVLANLPGYPARIVKAASGGYWLSIFAPRNQLVEFVLREKTYRSRMMTEIDPRYWICPALHPAQSPLEVMQDGAQKIGGALKPWAPSLSYGLIAWVGDDLLPHFSFHSRANGQRHGITSLVESGSNLLATTHGGSAIIELQTRPGTPA